MKKIKYNPIIEFHGDKMEKRDYFKIHRGSRKDCSICKMKNKNIKHTENIGQDCEHCIDLIKAPVESKLSTTKCELHQCQNCNLVMSDETKIINQVLEKIEEVYPIWKKENTERILKELDGIEKCIGCDKFKEELGRYKHIHWCPLFEEHIHQWGRWNEGKIYCIRCGKDPDNNWKIEYTANLGHDPNNPYPLGKCHDEKIDCCGRCNCKKKKCCG